MNENDRKTRLTIADRIGSLSKSMIIGDSPCVHLPINSRVVSYVYSNYMRFNDILPSSLKEKILAEEIDYAKHLIQMSFGVKRGPSFNKKFPEHSKTIREFDNWISENSISNNSEFLIDEPDDTIHFNVRTEFLSILRKLKPNFVLEKKFHTPSVLAFSDNDNSYNSCLIVFDIGRGRDFFSLLIGLKNIKAILDVANLFAGEQSYFKFNSKGELEKNISFALEYSDILIPEIENLLESV